MFSISFTPLYAFLNTDIMAFISKYATYQFEDVISMKTCLKCACDVTYISKKTYNLTGQGNTSNVTVIIYHIYDIFRRRNVFIPCVF